MCLQGLGHEVPGNPLGYVTLDVSNQQFRRSVIADSSQTPRSVWSTMSIQHAQVSQASQWSAMSANPPRSVTTPLTAVIIDIATMSRSDRSINEYAHIRRRR